MARPTVSPRSVAVLLAPLLALAACHGGHGSDASVPGDRSDTQPYHGVARGEALRFTGTEPFWGGEVTGDRMTYRTVDQPAGEVFTVSRFDGRGGLSYSGTLNGAAFTLAVAPGQCSDGMSDRTYPFVVTLQAGDDLRSGCAWSDAHPYAEPKAP